MGHPDGTLAFFGYFRGVTRYHPGGSRQQRGDVSLVFKKHARVVKFGVAHEIIQIPRAEGVIGSEADVLDCLATAALVTNQTRNNRLKVARLAFAP
jgi:hypothetical protein